MLLICLEGGQISFGHDLMGESSPEMRHDGVVIRFGQLFTFPRSARVLLSASLALGSLAVAIPAAQAQQAKDLKPAVQDDIYLYRGMGSSYVCNARAAKVDFPQAVGIAAATYVQLLNGRHGGKVESVGNKKLTNEQLFAGAEFQIITGAMQFCPKEVPADVKAKIEAAIKKQSAKTGQ